MARKTPIDIEQTIFKPTPRLEHFRRCLGYLQVHHTHLQAAGADKRELATLEATIAEMKRVIRAGDIFPLDTPEPDTGDDETPDQPLCPEGAEEAVAEIFNIALGDE